MKNIIVTGGSKGLGLEIVKVLLLSKLYRVYIINRNRSKELDKLLENNPDSLFFLSFDLKNHKKVKNEIFDEFLSFKVPIHGFVNNAAYAYDDIITNLNTDALEDMYSVNVFSSMNIVKYVIRNMLFNNIQGSIIHISSISVHTGYKGLSMYASTKGALEAFSRNTAREWGGKKIRSNCIVAGFMETNMSATLSPDQKNRIYKRTALKQPTTLYSVAETTKFLISDAAESITGQNIFVDSGTI